MDLKKVDLFRLECLRIIIEERHVTRAAIRLGISQPKLSGLLAQMRTVFGDPLLIKGAHGMMPTPFGEEIAKDAGKFLDGLHRALMERADFDPLKVTGVVSLHISDLLIDLILSEVVPVLRQEAPNLKLELRNPYDSQFDEILEKGEIDIAFSNDLGLSERLYRAHLIDMDQACLVSKNHPVIQGSLSTEQFLAAAHIQLCFQRSLVPYVNERQIDLTLGALGAKRGIAVTLSTGLGAARIIAKSDLIATMAAPVAYKVAETFDLQVFPLPLERPTISVYMIWHLRSHTSPVHRWLRNKIRMAAKRCQAR